MRVVIILHTLKKFKIIILAVLLIKLFMLIKMKKCSLYIYIEAILKEYDYCKKVINEHFNKNLIMSERDEQIYQ